MRVFRFPHSDGSCSFIDLFPGGTLITKENCRMSSLKRFTGDEEHSTLEHMFYQLLLIRSLMGIKVECGSGSARCPVHNAAMSSQSEVVQNMRELLFSLFVCILGNSLINAGYPFELEWVFSLQRN